MQQRFYPFGEANEIKLNSKIVDITPDSEAAAIKPKSIIANSLCFYVNSQEGNPENEWMKQKASDEAGCYQLSGFIAFRSL